MQTLDSHLIQHRAVEATVSGKFEQVLALQGDSYLHLILQSVSDIVAKSANKGK